MGNDNNKQGKRRYEKPVVMRFPLKPEEAVLGYCKSSGNSGPGGGNCIDPVTSGICQFPGS